MTAWVTFVHRISGYFRKTTQPGCNRTYSADMASLRVCDLGGSRHFWETMPSDMMPAHLTLLNIADDGQSRSHTGRFDTSTWFSTMARTSPSRMATSTS